MRHHKRKPHRLNPVMTGRLPWQRAWLRAISRHGIRREGNVPVAVFRFSGDELNHALTHGEVGLDPRHAASVRVWHESSRLRIRVREALLEPQEFAESCGPSPGS
jgi:hypothetical protein